MKWEPDEGEYVFNSGLDMYANGGVIGINPEGKVFTGFDMELAEDKVLTLAERVQLGQYMVRAWQKYLRAQVSDT